MKKDKKDWIQLRCPGCGKRKLDARKPYAVEVWCRECKKRIVFVSDVDSTDTSELQYQSDQ